MGSFCGPQRRRVILATLCYVRHSGRTLMLHRIKKEKDMHEGKWNGLGGKLGSEQTPDDKGITETLQGVACGDYTACAWSDKVVYCWGENDTGQLGLGDRNDRPLPTLVPGLPGAKHIALGPEFSCAVKLDGDVACWGSPSGGRLGNGELGFHRTEARPVLGLP